jgi:hypothetical protein
VDARHREDRFGESSLLPTRRRGKSRRSIETVDCLRTACRIGGRLELGESESIDGDRAR